MSHDTPEAPCSICQGAQDLLDNVIARVVERLDGVVSKEDAEQHFQGAVLTWALAHLWLESGPEHALSVLQAVFNKMGAPAHIEAVEMPPKTHMH